MRQWVIGRAGRWVVGSLGRVVFASLILLSGCGPYKPVPVKPPKQTIPELPAAVNTQGIRINWRVKQKDHQLWRVLDLNAVNGKIDAQTQSGTMSTATGTLYRQDRARAVFEAPTVHASNDQKTVVATGGVKVRSVDPPGILVTADRATWFIEKNVIVAEGNVYMEQRDPKTARKIAWGKAAHLTINTELREFSIP